MTEQATPTQEEALKAHVEFLNKVWTDEAFRARLESDPKSRTGDVADSGNIAVASAPCG